MMIIYIYIFIFILQETKRNKTLKQSYFEKINPFTKHDLDRTFKPVVYGFPGGHRIENTKQVDSPKSKLLVNFVSKFEQISMMRISFHPLDFNLILS